jgi:hypothetical protein
MEVTDIVLAPASMAPWKQGLAKDLMGEEILKIPD